MQGHKYPYAVRLLGFEGTEGAQIAAMLTLAPTLGPAYVCLHEDSLQDPDLFIANGSEIKGLTALAAVNPTPSQPALVVGAAQVEFPFPHIERPLDPGLLFQMLARLVDMRDEAVGEAGGEVFVERRRRKRLDMDLADPSDYLKMRKPRSEGAVLIIDKGGSLREHVAQLMARYQLTVEWTDSASTAVHLCDETAVATVLINTSTPGIDPYALCTAIKALAGGRQIAVVFLIGGAFYYDVARARAAGVRGLLDKPVQDRHLVATLKRLMSLS